jgi:alkylhydroperoxidase/carboxymuconolactone decarboxylase family protein YurZ
MKSNNSQEILSRVEAKRGYLLAHHEFFGYPDPEMLEKYDQLYEYLTLKSKFLSDRVKELVWMGILSAVFEDAGGPIHVKRARQAGISDQEIAEVFFLSQVALGFNVVSFVKDKWSQLIPSADIIEVYGTFIDHLTSKSQISPEIVELIFIGVYSALNKPEGLRFHLVRANQKGWKDEELYEAMSYILLPCGAPTLIEAALVLKDVLMKGEITPTSSFKTWLDNMQ